MDAAFGRYLPAQFARWDDLGSDEGMAHLCVSGVGGWYLTAVRNAEEVRLGHVTGRSRACNRRV